MEAPAVVLEAGPVVTGPESFEAFYRANVNRVHRALAVTLRHDALAREAVDEAMARAYAKWSTVSGLENPAGWVFRVGLNWATSWWRKVRREQPPSGVDLPAPDGSADHAVLARNALATLPLPQRAVVTCRILLDLSTAETAVVLGLTEGTVKSRLSRGLSALRTALTEKE